MIVKIYAFTKIGVGLCLKLNNLFGREWDIESFVPERFATVDSYLTGIDNLSQEQIQKDFASAQALIFVGAAGIAVRKIAPFVAAKDQDPAVIVIDEAGRYVIPILSGHIGGGNDLAHKIAGRLGAAPVITTATDINRTFAVDTWAAAGGYHIHNVEMVKEISGALLEGKPVGVHSAFEIKGGLPAGLELRDELPLGIYIGHTPKKYFDKMLWLQPKDIAVGLGCRRDVPVEALHDFFFEMLDRHRIAVERVYALGSVNLKKDEKAILALAKTYGYDLYFYAPEELARAMGSFTASHFVEGVTRVDNICERAAVLASGNGELIVPKAAGFGVTFGAAKRHWVVDFMTGV